MIQSKLPDKLWSRRRCRQYLEKRGYVKTREFGWVKIDRLNQALVMGLVAETASGGFAFVARHGEQGKAVLDYAPDEVAKFLQGERVSGLSSEDMFNDA